MQTISTFQFPPGVRFHPSDEELIVYYLLNKLNSRPLPAAVIGEVELYNYNPWDLPKKAPFGDAEWYFFSPRDRKYPNGARPNRTAASGYWKATGTDKPILSSSGSRIGVKKALVFYIGKPPNGVKTDWIMIEYRISDTLFRPQRSKASMRLDDWVLCRIRHKGNMSKNNAWDINPYSPNSKLMGGSTDQQSSVNNYYTNNNINNNNNTSETICPNYFLSQDCNLLASLLVSQAFPPTICTNITTTTTTNSQSQSPSQSQSSNSTAKNCVDPPYVPEFMINKESSDDHDHDHHHHDHQVINSNNSDTKITPQHLMNNKNDNNHLNSNNMLAENVSSCFFNQDVYQGRDELKHNLSNAIGNLHEFDMSAALFAEKFLQ